jgi:hypothetical protein
MSLPPPPPSDPNGPGTRNPTPSGGEHLQPPPYGFVPVSPLQPADPPRIGEFWLDARIAAAHSGIAYLAHNDRDVPAMLVLLSEGAAADPAARDRFAGVVNAMHIDTVLARGGQGQDTGRLARKFQPDTDDPVPPDAMPVAPWAALAYDGSPAAAREAERILDEVALASLSPLGVPAGPDYRHYWMDRVRPGLARLWPLPWPGRYDRAGWRTIFVSWLLMMLLAALAVLIAILIFRNQAPQAPPSPTGGSGSPPPQSSSPQSGSPSQASGSPSPQSGSPSPQSGSPSQSASASPTDESAAPSPSTSGSRSSSPSSSGSQSPPGSGVPSGSESGGSGDTPRSRL